MDYSARNWLLHSYLLSYFLFLSLQSVFWISCKNWKVSSRFPSFLREAFLSISVILWEIQESFKVSSTWNWNLKAYSPGKRHLFWELGTVQKGFLSRLRSIRQRRFFTAGDICTCSNGGDGIFTKAILLWAQFAASSELLTPSSDDDGNSNFYYLRCRIN